LEYKTIICEEHGKVVVVKLNLPESLNAISKDLTEDLDNVLNALEKDAKVAALVITGAGRAFCAGANLNEILHLEGVTAFYNMLKKVQLVINRVADYSKPVVAAVNGPALGGGLELCTACDICVASDNSVFGLPEINVGVLPGAGGMTRLSRMVGPHRARQLVMTGDKISAGQAKEMGLVWQVAPPEKLQATALELAARLAEKPPLAIQAAKRVINSSGFIDLTTAMDYEAGSVAMLFGTRDCREGLQAFVEKRQPKYKGK